MSRTTDPLEAASELASSWAQAAISHIQSKELPQTHPDFDGEHCIVCDDLIPFPRLALGKIRCVPCQSKLER